jgi:glycosyltransferase involved in cell wall biosynthesis
MAELNDILNDVEKIKISIVMQVNLGDYSDSRSDAIHKFHRAVESFSNQIYKNTELIIVADGCLRTQQHYNRSYKNDPSIRFVFMDRKDGSMEMRQTKEGDPVDYKYYRGFARKLGVAAATGDVITYMDSDDILAPEFTMTLMLIYNQDPDNDWWINTSWYDNHSAEWPDSETMYAIQDSDQVKLNYIDSEWRAVKLKPGKIVLSPWLLMHRNNLNVYWRDTYGIVSEDADFNKRLREMYPKGVAYSRPIYVRCHMPNYWDV